MLSFSNIFLGPIFKKKKKKKKKKLIEFPPTIKNLTKTPDTNCHHQIVFSKLNLKIEYPPLYEQLVWDSQSIKKCLTGKNYFEIKIFRINLNFSVKQ